MKKNVRGTPEPPRKILVVDDDESILDSLSLVLRDGGYDVRTTFKGKDVYVLAESFMPHLILLDVLMSGQDGREICRNLKNNERTLHIPILMISAHPSGKKEAIQFGADDFLAKPFETEELLGMIRNYIR